MVENKKIGVISLGCDKNRVDTEKMLAILKERHTLVSDIEQAEIIIVNTCAFLESSRKEAVFEILEAAQYKNNGALEKLIVTGCLPQKFVDEIAFELTEVDAFLGVSDYAQMLEVIDKIYRDERVINVGVPRGECGKKRVSALTLSIYQVLGGNDKALYLKIAITHKIILV